MSERTRYGGTGDKTGLCEGEALDENMNEVIYEGTELLARAFCHEIDHLDGKMYTELVEGDLHRVTYDEDEE